MKIAHFAPFAPNRSGLYEAARDMCAADDRAGHEVRFVDVGLTVNGQRQPSVVEQPGLPDDQRHDDRAGYDLRPVPYTEALDADVLIAHSGMPENWIAWGSKPSPIIWIQHGRPLACFRPERAGAHRAYSDVAELAARSRVRKVVTFWPEHVPFWRELVPPDKLVCLDAPPIDERRFRPDGKMVSMSDAERGRWCVLVADASREDVDTFEVLHALILAAERVSGLKVHVLGAQFPLGAMERVLYALKKRGALAEPVRSRVPNMEEWYRLAGLVVTPHRIATRTMAEALCCGTPVVAAQPCRWTPYTGIPEDVESMATAIACAIEDLRQNQPAVREATLATAAAFRLEHYEQAMQGVYDAVL